MTITSYLRVVRASAPVYDLSSLTAGFATPWTYRAGARRTVDAGRAARELDPVRDPCTRI
ncbi:hypothetical protein ACRAWF_25400 [Streptomyces sp. L7]